MCLQVSILSVVMNAIERNLQNLFNSVITVPGSVAYLYARKLFGWDQPQFALFSTISSLAAVAGKTNTSEQFKSTI